MKLHVPLMIPVITETLRKAVVKKGSTLWFEDMRQVAFTVATRAVLGDLVSDKTCKELFLLFRTMSQGAIQMVCSYHT